MAVMATEPMQPANDAETRLRDCARRGDIADVKDLDDKTVRAAFLRDLCVRPDDYGVHAKGVRLGGAEIADPLDFEAATLPRPLGLLHCALAAELILRDAETRTLLLSGSTFAGIEADRLRLTGGLFLPGATITGETRLLGADIEGNLACHGADFDNPDGDAFGAQRMTVGGRLFLIEVVAMNGALDLMHAGVGDLADDGSGWPDKGKLGIDGLVYENLGPMRDTAAERTAWLRLMPEVRDGEPAYFPQPYEQLIKVFKAAGHEREARLMAIAKQDAYRDYLRRQARAHKDDRRWLRRSWLWFTGWLIGYGYEPWRILWPMALALAIGALTFQHTFDKGAMRPAKERIYAQAEYSWAKDPCEKVPGRHFVFAKSFRDKGFCLPDDYPRFNPLAYAIDAFFPIVDLHQESYWLPKEHGFFRFYLWFHIALGWFLTTIAVVGFTGLIKKD